MKRTRYFSWYIGFAIILLANVFLLLADAFLLLGTDEGTAELVKQTALLVIPVVALALIFLVFKSQNLPRHRFIGGRVK